MMCGLQYIMLLRYCFCLVVCKSAIYQSVYLLLYLFTCADSISILYPSIMLTTVTRKGPLEWRRRTNSARLEGGILNEDRALLPRPRSSPGDHKSQKAIDVTVAQGKGPAGGGVDMSEIQNPVEHI